MKCFCDCMWETWLKRLKAAAVAAATKPTYSNRAYTLLWSFREHFKCREGETTIATCSLHSSTNQKMRFAWMPSKSSRITTRGDWPLLTTQITIQNICEAGVNLIAKKVKCSSRCVSLFRIVNALIYVLYASKSNFFALISWATQNIDALWNDAWLCGKSIFICTWFFLYNSFLVLKTHWNVWRKIDPTDIGNGLACHFIQFNDLHLRRKLTWL